MKLAILKLSVNQKFLISNFSIEYYQNVLSKCFNNFIQLKIELLKYEENEYEI